MARSLRRSSRLYCLTIFAVLGSVILLAQHPSINKNLPPHLSSLSQLQWSSPTPKTERDRANDLLNTHTLAIWDNNQFHEEVHGSVLWTFSQFENLTVKFYRPKWRWHFDLVVQSFWPDEPTPKEEFFTDLEKDSTIRWVFLPTIDFQKKDFEGISEQLQTIWTNRKPSERFTIVGLRHWGNYDLTKVEMWWAQRDALSLLTLGDHVTDYLIEGQRKNAMKWKNEEEQEAIKRIRVATFVPAFPPDVTDVDDFGKSGPGGSGVEGLNKALIQSGHFDEGHRAMTPLFEEIKNDLVANPGVWGYKLDAETNDYIPIDPNDPNRFTLKILGLSKTEWPKELNNMVNMESYLPYQPYYDRIHDADIILPAFGTTPYGQSRASSTMGVAATARTPLTVTEDVNQAYGWFCPALARTRDNNMTEVEFIRQVRMGNIPWESKTTVQDDFIKCQYDWTSHNMLTVAELFTLPPEGSNVRDVYFGSDAEWVPAPKEGLVIDEKTLR